MAELDWKRLDSLYEQAMARDATERPAFLDDACSGDETLREKLEELLFADPTSNDTWFDKLAHHLAEVTVAECEFRTGARLCNRYTVRERIGEGGMAGVYRVEDEFGRDLAFKVIKPELRGSPEAEWRFLTEARVTARLQHPNIVPVHSVGQLDDGRFYFTMKLVKGKTLKVLLSETCNDTTPEVRRVTLLRHFERVTDALAFAHGREADSGAGVPSRPRRPGIVHRDLKPENVMVGQFGEVQLMDWGIAKVLGAETEDSGAALHPDVRSLREVGDRPVDGTAAGRVLGTFAYMAPEQLQGRTDRIDTRTDVFGLGAILCEILTGEPPYPTEIRAPGGATGGARDPLQRRPLQPAHDRLAGCSADPELVALATDCLQENSDDRPADAGQIAVRVSGYLTRVEERRQQAEKEKAAADARAEEAEQTRLAEERAREEADRRAAADRARARAEHGRRKRTQALAAAVLVAVISAVGGGAWAWVTRAQSRLREEALTSRADEAHRSRLRSNLTSIQDEGRRLVAEMAIIKENVGPHQQAEVQAALDKFVERRWAADGVVQELERSGVDERASNAQTWNEMSADLRRGAVAPVTAVRLLRETAIPLPCYDPALAPLVAIRGDLSGGVQEIAVLDFSSNDIVFLTPTGEPVPSASEPRKWRLPGRLAKGAVSRTTTERSWLSRTFNESNVHFKAARFEYTRDDRSLRLQIGPDAATWALPSGTVREVQLEGHQLPQPLYGAYHSFCGKYLAFTDGARVKLKVAEWQSGADPSVVWQARGGDPAAGGERIQHVTFGPDERSVYVLTDHRLAVVDAATGAVAETALEDGDRRAREALIPYSGGVALVVKSPSKELRTAFQLVLWRAVLPEVGAVRVFHFESPVQCMSLAGPDRGRLIAGTADGLVHATEGVLKSRQFGIAHLGQEKAVSIRDELALGLLPSADRFFVHTRSSVRTGAKPTVFRRDAYAPGPRPFGGWGFIADLDLFTVERSEPAPSGERIVREWYHPGTGARAALPAAFPQGRLVALSDDGALAAFADSSLTRSVYRIVRLKDGSEIGAIAKPRNTPLRLHFCSDGVRSFVLATTLLPADGAACEIWQLSRAPQQLEFRGQVGLPHFDCSIVPIPSGTRAIAWRPRGTGAEPNFAHVLDLASATKICSLQGFSATGGMEVSLFTPTRLIHATRYGLTGDQNDAYRVGCFDLSTGAAIDVDNHLWSNDEPPEMELSTDGRLLALAGRLFETGQGCLCLRDLATGKLIKEIRFAPVGKPRIARIASEYVAVEQLVSGPVAGATIPLAHFAWSDGRQLNPTGAKSPEVIRVSRTYMGEYLWQLWNGPEGLSLQRGYAGGRVPLLKTERLGKDSAVQAYWPSEDTGVLALSGSINGLWGARSGDRIREFPRGHRCLGFDARRHVALTVDPTSHECKTWDAASGVELASCNLGKLTGRGLDLSKSRWQLDAGGRRLAVHIQGELQLWNIQTGERVATIQPAGHTSPVRLIAQHAPAGLVASAGENGVIFLWDLRQNRLVRTIVAHGEPLTALCFSADGAQVASAASDGVLAVHSVTGALVWSTKLDERASATCLTCCPDLLAAGMQDGRVISLSLKSNPGVRLNAYPRSTPAPQPVRVVAFSPDGSRLAAGTEGGTEGEHVMVGDSRAGRWDRQWSARSPVRGIAFVGNRLLATAGQNVQFWNPERAQQPVWTVDVPGGLVHALAYNDQTGELAVLDERRDVIVYSFPDLYASLARSGLDFDGAPAEWSKPAHAGQPSDAPGSDERARRFEELAEKCHRQQSWGSLLWACSVALTESPANARLWWLRGEAESNQKDDRRVEALAAYTKALDIAPNAKALQARGDIYKRMGNLAAAEADYSGAIRLSVADAQLFSRRGALRAELAIIADRAQRLKESRAHFEQALADFLTVARLHPDDGQNWSRIGSVQAVLGNTQEAALAIEKAVDLVPYDVGLYRQLITVLIKAGRTEEAKQIHQRIANRFRDIYIDKNR